MQTQTDYQIGKINFISQSRNVPRSELSPQVLFDAYYHQHPWGIEQRRPNQTPPLEVFIIGAESIGKQWRKLRIIAGDLGAECERHHPGKYEMVKALVGLDDVSISSVEDYAYIMRNTQYCARQGIVWDKLSINHYRGIAPLAPNWQQQRVFLRVAALENMGVNEFTAWMRSLRQPSPPEQKPPTYQSDVLFETAEQLHTLEVQYQEQCVQSRRSLSKLQRASEYLRQWPEVAALIPDGVARDAVGAWVRGLEELLK